MSSNRFPRSFRLLLVALPALLMTLSASAQTWLASPGSGDWETASNWTPASVPGSSPTDTAVFDASSTTSVTLTSGRLLDGITFNAGAPSYLLTNSVALYLEGAGIVNNSSSGQTLRNNGALYFEFASSAGSAAVSNGNTLTFSDTSTAGSASLDNRSNLYFNNSSSAGSASVTNSGTLWFSDDSTAGSAVINDTGGLVFFNNATAGSAAITNNATVYFTDTSTAGGSTITTANGGTLYFTTSSTGGTARLITNAGGALDVSGRPSGLSTGSIEGAGGVQLGAYNLTTGVNNLSTTVSGVIADGGSSGGTGGSLTKAGTGILALTGANTYSGGTTVNAGTLEVGTGGTLGTGGAWVNAQLRYVDNASAGANTVTTNFGGTTRFFGAAQGGTARFITANNGTFDISGATSSVTVGSIEGDGFHFLGSKTLVAGANNLDTLVTGPLADGGGSGGTGGSLTKIGTGVLSLTSVNTYTGGTNVVGGTLRVGDDSALGSGALTLNGGTLATMGAFSTSRLISLGSNGGTWNTGSFDSTLNGTLSGVGSLTKSGSGALTLTSANTYSGGTTLSGGSLSAGSATALGTGAVVLNAGTLQTAGGPLTLQVGGNYSQASSATLRMGLGNTGGDAVTAAGSATLGGTLQVYSLSAYTPNVGDSFSVLWAAGGISGRFGTYSNLLTGPRLFLVYQPTRILLTAIHPSFAQLGLTPNQTAVGGALDAGYLSLELEPIILAVGTAPASSLPAVYDQLSPAALTALFKMAFAASRDQSALVQQRLALRINVAPSARQESLRLMGGPMFAADLPPHEERAIARTVRKGKDWGVYVNGGGNFGRLTGDSNAAGYPFTLTSVNAGADGRLLRNVVGGLTLGYVRGNAAPAGGSMDLTGIQGGLYAQWYEDGFHAGLLANGAFNSFTTQRAGYGGTASASGNGTQFGGWAKFGYDAVAGAMILGPFASGQFTSAGLNAFRESGSSAPLSFAGQSQDSLRSEVGFRMKGSFGSRSPVLTPSLSLAWEHEYGAAADGLAASLPGQTTTFLARGPATGADGLAARMGLDTQWADWLFVYVQYQGRLFFSNYDSQSFAGGVQIGF